MNFITPIGLFEVLHTYRFDSGHPDLFAVQDVHQKIYFGALVASGDYLSYLLFPVDRQMEKRLIQGLVTMRDALLSCGTLVYQIWAVPAGEDYRSLDQMLLVAPEDLDVLPDPDFLGSSKRPE